MKTKAPIDNARLLWALEQKHGRAYRRMIETSRKLTRLTGILAKWRKKVRYYEREIGEFKSRGGPRPARVKKTKPTRLYGDD